jgi:DNA mismatch repair protein MutS
VLPFDVAATAPAAPARDALREKLAEIEPDSLSPREAQAILYELRGLLDRQQG